MLALRFQWYPYILASEKFECYVTFAPGIKREYRVGEFFGIDQDEDVLLITHGATIGGRFFIRDRFGLYLEMGYGLHNLAVGLVFGGKLKRHVVDTR